MFIVAASSYHVVGTCGFANPSTDHVGPAIGEVLFGTDSHTCNAGAFGQFASGVGNTDAGFILGTGKLLIKACTLPLTYVWSLDLSDTGCCGWPLGICRKNRKSARRHEREPQANPYFGFCSCQDANPDIGASLDLAYRIALMSILAGTS